jgi:hypothetical protein
MASDNWFIEVAAQAMRTRLVSCCTFVNLRFDLPHEERFLTPIHQDFPFRGWRRGLITDGFEMTLVSPGGIVLLDEYGMDAFPGEGAAFDEYFGSNRPRLEKFPYTPTPGDFSGRPDEGSAARSSGQSGDRHRLHGDDVHPIERHRSSAPGRDPCRRTRNPAGPADRHAPQADDRIPRPSISRISH